MFQGPNENRNTAFPAMRPSRVLLLAEYRLSSRLPSMISHFDMLQFEHTSGYYQTEENENDSARTIGPTPMTSSSCDGGHPPAPEKGGL